ncbi:hypothetical protein D9756_003511 [Leucocoprinus leucothites]|uniref:Uncharacterized protein n=1 Tax=Leucocoprinus leucothites TaxID=201217 RepID=A0A8H5G6A9_9AGAR|nr:hypothetical protein D9756_003511 [Leucoagaricus leucothites]
MSRSVSRSVSPSVYNEVVQKLSHYLWCGEQATSWTRQCPDILAHYEAEYQEWTLHPLFLPPPGDRARRDAYFKACDEIISKKATSPRDWVRIVFASWAATQVILDQDLSLMPDKQSWAAHRAALDYVSARKHEEEGKGPARGSRLCRFTSLLGQVIKYRHSSEHIRYFKLVSYEMDEAGRLKFLILDNFYDSCEEVWLSAGELDEFLQRRML